MSTTPIRKLINVTKRSGAVTPLDYDKIHSMITWACEGLKGVSESQVAISAHLQFYDKIPTRIIHETLVKSAINLISEEAPDYQYVAARLLLVGLRKEAYGSFTPPSLLSLIKKCIADKKYAADLLESYSEEEINQIETIINYSRDLQFTYAGLKEFAESYLVKDKAKGILFETPQQAYIVLAMTIFSVEDVKGELFADEAEKRLKRLAYIKELYDALSLFKISLPTPIMANCRTPIKQFASCTVIDCGDSIESIFTTSHAIGRYIVRGAGIGLNMGRLRGDGTAVRNGLGFSTGCLPFYKLMESTTNSCNQGGIRKGASTVFFPFWHIQAEELIPLKDARGTENNRIQALDYAVQLTKLFYDRVRSGGNLTLFCPSEVPDLYEAFFESTAKFEELYLKYETKKSLNKRVVKAKDLLDLIIRVRSETGRLYIHNVDNTNDHGSYDTVKAPVHQSNLCMEITIPSAPLAGIDDEKGLIGLCTLGAVNLGKIKDLNKDMEFSTRILVRALDNLLEYQQYPIKAAERFGRDYRALGVGVTNFAYYLAKKGLKYGSEGTLPLVHETFEAMQYYLLKASNDLAKERGRCGAYETTKYSQGVLPIDKYKKTVDEICTTELKQNWEDLRQMIKLHGLRHTVLSALMPSEKSSVISNATNGIEAPRAFLSVKNNKNSGSIPMIVPEYAKLKKSYQLTWDKSYSNKAYIQIAAVIQKFIDQSISSDLYYNPARYFEEQNGDSNAVSKEMYRDLVKDIFYAWKVGLKTLYYSTTNDSSSESHKGEEAKKDPKKETVEADQGCPDGVCSI